jgi:hypothetical protein
VVKDGRILLVIFAKRRIMFGQDDHSDRPKTRPDYLMCSLVLLYVWHSSCTVGATHGNILGSDHRVIFC